MISGLTQGCQHSPNYYLPLESAGHPYKQNSTPSLLFTQCGSNKCPPMQVQALGVIGHGSIHGNISGTFNHILAWFQGELLKIWEMGAELRHLTGMMTDIPSAGYWYGFVFIFIICFMGLWRCCILPPSCLITTSKPWSTWTTSSQTIIDNTSITVTINFPRSWRPSNLILTHDPSPKGPFAGGHYRSHSGNFTI